MCKFIKLFRFWSCKIWIGTRIRSVVDPDPDHFGNLDPDQIKIKIRIRTHPDPHQNDKLDPEPDPHQFADE